MKNIKKGLISILVISLICAAAMTLTACGGYTVTFVLPGDVTGTAPEAVKYSAYEEFTLPDAPNASKVNASLIGWKDAADNFYEKGTTFKMGSANITLTAVFQAKTLTSAYCTNPGTMQFGDRLIGPTPAHTQFYADKTWVADALGTASFSHFEGTWDITTAGVLSMKLVIQDGATRNTDLTITSAMSDKTFSFALTHPDDRGTSTKTHTNYVSKYALIKAVNETLGMSITLPSEPTFSLSFNKNNSAATGTIDNLGGKVGAVITLPTTGFTRTGYNLTAWSIDGKSYNPGASYTVVSADLTANATWTAA